MPQHPTDRGRVSHLVSARELNGFVPDARTDVRRWPVFASDARLVGAVDRLLVEAATGRIRYASVSLALHAESDDWSTPSGSVLVPVGVIRRMEDKLAIVLDAITSAQLAAAPRLPRRAITRADEDATLAVYGMATSRDVPAGQLYDRPQYDQDRLTDSVAE